MTDRPDKAETWNFWPSPSVLTLLGGGVVNLAVVVFMFSTLMADVRGLNARLDKAERIEERRTELITTLLDRMARIETRQGMRDTPERRTP